MRTRPGLLRPLAPLCIWASPVLVLITDTVPSAPLVTYAVAPLGLTATPNGVVPAASVVRVVVPVIGTVMVPGLPAVVPSLAVTVSRVQAGPRRLVAWILAPASGWRRPALRSWPLAVVRDAAASRGGADPETGAGGPSRAQASRRITGPRRWR